ncbi:saccharopine dehydrogenase [Brevibacillus brevis]|uniref:saccharopine dehydrogenase family protein n=1 Tax=Brevibacillus brevis TaxID=1393 RepID=UPI000B385C2F|nr:saccharopine dehydrogenase NADP-binding domain-containing protein [Brevibacillus brevis]OUQ86350.1 saccharopine dehydrogenase [Brevibacillus brevis]
MSKDRIVVVGGYGHVGATICKNLGEAYPGRVYAAGRSLEKAEAFCREADGKVLPLQLDIHKPLDQSMLEKVKLVVMCLDQWDTAFVEGCMRNGTHYLDISANGHFLTQIEQWGSQTETKNMGTAVLSVGLAPGLTNLLAGEAHRLLDQVSELDIFIMLGLGDRHGKAAIEWTVDNLCTSYEVINNHQRVTVESMTEGKLVDFGPKLGKKHAYRFPFSDQQSLARTLDVPTVSTRLCFDLDGMTRVVAGLKSIGICRLLHQPKVRAATIEAFGRWKMGDDRFAIKVEARGKRGTNEATVECLLYGRDQSNMTAMVAAAVAKSLYEEAFPPGVHHMEQLFSLEKMRFWLEHEASLTVFVREAGL